MNKTVLLLILLCFHFIPVQSQATIENNLLSVADQFDHQVEPSMALGEDGEVFVGWKNADTHTGGGRAVSYTISGDNGETWSQPELVDDFFSGAGQSDPWMHYFDGKLYYVYIEFDDTLTTSQITLATTADNGQTWEYTNMTDNDYFADKETFDIDNEGNIYLVYDDVDTSPDGLNTMRLSKSLDGGKTFVDNTTFGDAVEGAGYLGPYVYASDKKDVLYVAWTQFGASASANSIYFDKSSDGGDTWGNDVNINPDGYAAFEPSPDGRPGKVTLPVIEEDSTGRIYVVWEDISSNPEENDFDIFMTYSDDGINWVDKIKVSDNVSGDQWNPDMEIDNNDNVHFIFYQDTDGYNLVYKKYDPNTSEFSNTITITSEKTDSSFTRPGEYVVIKIDTEDNIHTVWSDGRNGVLDIYYAKFSMNFEENSNNNWYYLLLILPVAIILYLRIKKK